MIMCSLFIWDAWFARYRGFLASRIWCHCDLSAMGASRDFLRRILKDQPRFHDSDSFLLRCDAWFPRIRGFIANRIWRHRQSFARGRSKHFLWQMLKEQPWLMIVIHSCFIVATRGIRNNKVVLPPGHTSSSVLRQGALHALFHDGFWKSDHDFLIAFHNNLSAVMHGFKYNGVLLQIGYDVIVTPPLCVDGIWKSDSSFIIMVHWHISCISYRFEVMRHLFCS